MHIPHWRPARFDVGQMIGIDLGTTSSCVAVMEGGVPQVIPNQEGARTTPSVVGFSARGEPLVGQIAKRQALTNPKNTVFAFDRLIGRKWGDPEAEQARQFLPFELVPAENGDLHIKIEDRVYAPAEISSFVLRKLRAAAEEYLGEAVEKAIITVPADFNDVQRQAIKDAGLIAGLSAPRGVLNAPTAAALAYGLKSQGGDGQEVAVYDLGGGTFDITILEMAEGLFQVRATGGDTYLGGEDFDQRIVDWLIEEFQGETRIDLKQDRMALRRLKEAAEKAKCELSTAPQTEIVLPHISADASGPRHLNTVLTREHYETLSNDLLEKTIEPCEQCLADAGLKPAQIDEVVLVGGQTRAPQVSELVRMVFGREANRAVNPDEGAAMGAAIQAGITQGEVKDLVLLDVTPHTLGIETRGGTFTPIIERNSTVPTRKSRMVTTVADNQTRIPVHVLQGESDMFAHNKSLARFELTNIPPAPKGESQVEVSFEIDVHGIVSASAQDQATGRHQSMTIRPSGGLSQSEVSRLAEEAWTRELEEKESKDFEAVVRQLDGLVATTLHSVKALEGKLEPGERREILQSIEKARKALDSAKKGEVAAVSLPAGRGERQKARRGGSSWGEFWDGVLGAQVVRLDINRIENRCRLISLQAAGAVVLTRSAVSIGDSGSLRVPDQMPDDVREVVVTEVMEIPPPPRVSRFKRVLSDLTGPRASPVVVVLRFPGPGLERATVRVPLPAGPRSDPAGAEITECLGRMERAAALIGRAMLRS